MGRRRKKGLVGRMRVRRLARGAFTEGEGSWGLWTVRGKEAVGAIRIIGKLLSVRGIHDVGVGRHTESVRLRVSVKSCQDESGVGTVRGAGVGNYAG